MLRSFYSSLVLFLICVAVIFSCRKKAGENPSPDLGDLIVPPSNTVKTDTILPASITVSTVSVSGIIVVKGKSKPTKYGFYYSPSNPFPEAKDNTILSSDTISLTKPSRITARIASLAPNTVYYLAAFAIFNKDTVYGETQKFTTKINPLVAAVQTTSINAISYTSATYQGAIVGLGTNLTEYGFVYSLTSMPTIADKKVVTGTTPPATVPYNYQTAVTGLVNGTTYYVRAYAKDNSGYVYGENKSFRTLAYALPVVQTGAVTNVSYFTATVAGSITSQGAPNVTEYGFVYSTTNVTPTITDSKIVAGGSVGTLPASFTSNLTLLTNNTGYYVRAYATNSSGTSYGALQRFATNDAKPVANTTRVTYTESIRTISAYGEILAQGASPITRYGFVYGTSTAPTLADGVAEVGTTVSLAFPLNYNASVSFARLPSGTYYVRSFATNASGTSYGTAISAVVYVNPVVVTGNNVITGYVAQLSGSVTSGGSALITEYGFIYTPTANATFGFNYGDSGVLTVKGSSTATLFPFNFTLNADGAITNTFYDYKTYTKSVDGIVYGEVKTFRINIKD